MHSRYPDWQWILLQLPHVLAVSIDSHRWPLKVEELDAEPADVFFHVEVQAKENCDSTGHGTTSITHCQ